MLVTVVAVITIAAVVTLVPGTITVVPMVRTAVTVIARSDDTAAEQNGQADHAAAPDDESGD